MDTVREFRRAVEDAIDDMNAQYGRRVPACEQLHYELGFSETPAEDAEERLAILKQQKVNIEEGDIKLTAEHEELHETLRRLALGVMSDGGDAGQVAATMLAAGRRLGFREAAALLSDDDVR